MPKIDLTINWDLNDGNSSINKREIKRKENNLNVAGATQ